MASLQQQVTHEQGPPAVQELGRLLKATVEQLQALGSVSPAAISEAKTQSEAIFNRSKATLDDAARASALPTRVVGKTTPVEPVEMQDAPVDHRFRSKQPAKRFIYDHFDPKAKKAPFNKRRSFSEPPDAGSADL